jgi:hypothetical protein
MMLLISFVYQMAFLRKIRKLKNDASVHKTTAIQKYNKSTVVQYLFLLQLVKFYALIYAHRQHQVYYKQRNATRRKCNTAMTVHTRNLTAYLIAMRDASKLQSTDYPYRRKPQVTIAKCDPKREKDMNTQQHSIQ